MKKIQQFKDWTNNQLCHPMLNIHFNLVIFAAGKSHCWTSEDHITTPVGATFDRLGWLEICYSEKCVNLIVCVFYSPMHKKWRQILSFSYMIKCVVGQVLKDLKRVILISKENQVTISKISWMRVINICEPVLNMH